MSFLEIQSTRKTEVPALLSSCWDRVFNLRDARFFELPARSELWTTALARAQEIHQSFSVTCVIGIGGSSLGARALWRGFSSANGHRLVFAESPDAISAQKWLKELGPLDKVHFLAISKSGQTLETLTLMDFWSAQLASVNLNFARQCTVVCGPKSNPLRTWAEANGVPTLPVPEDVGGRFSVLTPVGLLPAALMGIDLKRLQAGAAWALGQEDLVLQLTAASLQSWQEQKWITQMWVYSDALQELGLWWQQLWSESLAKTNQKDGKPAGRVSTPLVCVGPQDQHSQLQQLQDGERDKWVIQIRDVAAEQDDSTFSSAILSGLLPGLKSVSLGRILKSEADGFLGALRESKINYLILIMSSSQPESWGAFLMTWELVIAVLGEALGINAFDQPGVELGKKLTLQSLRQPL